MKKFLNLSSLRLTTPFDGAVMEFTEIVTQLPSKLLELVKHENKHEFLVRLNSQNIRNRLGIEIDYFITKWIQ